MPRKNESAEKPESKQPVIRYRVIPKATWIGWWQANLFRFLNEIKDLNEPIDAPEIDVPPGDDLTAHPNELAERLANGRYVLLLVEVRRGKKHPRH